jgi:hypothetical protein
MKKIKLKYILLSTVFILLAVFFYLLFSPTPTPKTEAPSPQPESAESTTTEKISTQFGNLHSEITKNLHEGFTQKLEPVKQEELKFVDDKVNVNISGKYIQITQIILEKEYGHDFKIQLSNNGKIIYSEEYADSTLNYIKKLTTKTTEYLVIKTTGMGSFGGGSEKIIYYEDNKLKTLSNFSGSLNGGGIYPFYYHDSKGKLLLENIEKFYSNASGANVAGSDLQVPVIVDPRTGKRVEDFKDIYLAEALRFQEWVDSQDDIPSEDIYPGMAENYAHYASTLYQLGGKDKKFIQTKYKWNFDILNNLQHSQDTFEQVKGPLSRFKKEDIHYYHKEDGVALVVTEKSEAYYETELLDTEFTKIPLPEPKNLEEIRNIIEEDQGVGTTKIEDNYAYEWFNKIKANIQKNPITSSFSPEAKVYDLKEVDLDKDGKKEQIITFILCQDNCYYTQIVKDGYIIFSTNTYKEVSVKKINSDGTFVIEWRPYGTKKFRNFPNCCIPAYRESKFKFVNNKVELVEEVEKMLGEVKLK